MGLFVALLRGINVSGQKKILMADLRKLLEGSGFDNVQTYIQSGNIIFSSPGTSNPDEIRTSIEETIKKEYSYHVDVTVLVPKEIEDILSGNPFLGPDTDITKLGVTILNTLPEAERVELLSTVHYPPDEFKYKGKIVYTIYPNGFGRSKLSNNFYESKLKVSATSRNWKTMLKLKELTSPQE